MNKVERIQKDIDQEIERIEQSPEELEIIEKGLASLGKLKSSVFALVSREVFHDFLQVCKSEGVPIGTKLAELVTEYSKKDFKGKKPYDPEYDYKALMAKNFL